MGALVGCGVGVMVAVGTAVIGKMMGGVGVGISSGAPQDVAPNNRMMAERTV